jgi:hypothetical protein
LLSHFSGYSSFPNTIDVRVEAFSEGTVNDDLRKRCKYLAHLPEGADVVFIEADLENVVGAEGLKNFEGALKMRTARRKEKARKDDRARARAEDREREERADSSWTRSATVKPAEQRADSPLEELVTVGGRASQPVPTSGAWGSRTFASALHTPPQRQATPASRREVEEDDWDLDVAWHEFEQRNVGRNKRSKKLVVLGSGGGGRRR